MMEKQEKSAEHYLHRARGFGNTALIAGSLAAGIRLSGDVVHGMAGLSAAFLFASASAYYGACYLDKIYKAAAIPPGHR